jgi:hypothetical protein
MKPVRPVLYGAAARCVALTIFVTGSIMAGHPASAQPPADEDEKTGEWKGTFDWSARQPVPSGTQYFSGHLDLSLDEYEDGALKGTLIGSQTEKLETSCPSVALSPGTAAARLTGKVVRQEVTINVSDPTTTPPRMSPCPTGGPPAASGEMFKLPHFDEALRSLTPVDKYNYEFDREWTVVTGRYPFTLHYTVKFQRVEILPRAAD